MLRLLSILSLLLFFSCETQITDNEFESLEALTIDNLDHDDSKILEAKAKVICPYLFINIVTSNPDLINQTMCVCPTLATGTCYSTGNLGWPFTGKISIPIGISSGCAGFVEGGYYAVGLGQEAPFGNIPTSIQLYVHVTDAYNAASEISYYPETNTFTLDNVGSGMTISVLTNFWIC